MYTLYYIIIGGVAIIGIVSFLLSKKKMKQLNDSYNNLDLLEVTNKAKTYQKDLIESGYDFLLKNMDDDRVDAWTAGFLEHGVKDEVMDQATNLLKGMATLGTVRFKTVHTAKYLLISGKNVHLLDTDKEGEICTHLVFDENRMRNAKIQEIPELSKGATLGKFPLKYYKIIFETHKKSISIVVSNLFSDINYTPTSSIEDQIDNFGMGNYFLHILGQNFPNLKISTDIQFS